MKAVWVSAMGQLYHADKTCLRLADANVHNAWRGATLHGGSYMTLSKARGTGLEPCPECDPPAS